MTQINFQIRKLIFLLCSTGLYERFLALTWICLVALGRETEGFLKKKNYYYFKIHWKGFSSLLETLHFLYIWEIFDLS